MSDTPPINAYISLSLHPDTLKKFASHPDAGVANHARRAMTVFGSAYQRLIGGEAEAAAIRADKDLSTAACLRRASEATHRAKQEAHESLCKLAEHLDRAVAERAVRLEDAVRPSEPGPYAGEARAHVRALANAAERIGFLIAAAKRGDAETAFTVLDAPGFLTGLDELSATDLGAIRRRALLALAPKSASGLEDLERLRDAVHRGAKAVA